MAIAFLNPQRLQFCVPATELHIALPSLHDRYPRTRFGERLYAARLAIGLSQAQVAVKLGITQKGYAVWERHSVALRPEQIEQITEIFGISPNYLFGRSKK